MTVFEYILNKQLTFCFNYGVERYLQYSNLIINPGMVGRGEVKIC